MCADSEWNRYRSNKHASVLVRWMEKKTCFFIFTMVNRQRRRFRLNQGLQAFLETTAVCGGHCGWLAGFLLNFLPGKPHGRCFTAFGGAVVPRFGGGLFGVVYLVVKRAA